MAKQITCYYCKRTNSGPDGPLRISHLTYEGVGICIDCLVDAVDDLKVAISVCKEASIKLIEILENQ